MKWSRWSMLASVVLATALCLPAWATRTAVPGTLNYVEGNASFGAQTLDSQAIGSAQLQPGESLNTENGKAEILLTPGVYLRAGEHSSVRLISSSLIDTRVAVDRGQAMVEVDQLYPQNDIRVMQQGVSTRLMKTGLYDFDANQSQVRVLEGQAEVQSGDRMVKVKGGHEVTLNQGMVSKAMKFDKNEVEQSDLYRWSSLRSSYLAEANVSAARTYFVNGWYGPGWFGAGWYWSPWFDAYTFIPGGGFFYNPFGWGFYSPLFAYRAPVVFGGGYFHHFGPGYHPVYAYRGHFAPRGATAFNAHPAPGFYGHGFSMPAPRMSMPRAGFHGGWGRR